jgi:OmpA-OmpF porin, OOP family
MNSGTNDPIATGKTAVRQCTVRICAVHFWRLNLYALLLIPGICCFSTASSQVRLGILGGLHSANILETNHIPGWDTTTKKFESGISGFQLGAIVEIPLGHKGFYFQPAITYTTKGRQYNKNNDSATSVRTDTVYSKQTLNLGYIDIPLNFTYKLPLSSGHNKHKVTSYRNNFFISAGPTVSFFNNGKLTSQSLARSTNKYANESDPVTVGKGTGSYQTVDLGVNARAGFEFGSVFLNAYFSRGLTNFYNAPYQGTFHHQLFGASLGIWLSSTAPPPPPPVKDTDKDGIPDDEDLCPLQPGTAKWHGCPVPDSDHDGIDDEHDSCPKVPGLARYNGCPIPDTDHDGINDEEDKCPNQPGLARYDGCPIPDRDGDGVNDEEDKCPDTPGPKENQGCPVIKQEMQDKINYTAKNILFNRASDQMTDSSKLALNDIAALLMEHPQWHLTIEGYTDNSGTPAGNLILSQKRAASVSNYLISKGVPADRLTAIGFGIERPIADNTTPAGRSTNRRVEMKLSINK